MTVSKRVFDDPTDGLNESHLAIMADLDPDQRWPYVVVMLGEQTGNLCGMRIVTNVANDDKMVCEMLASAAEHIANPDMPCDWFLDNN